MYTQFLHSIIKIINYLSEYFFHAFLQLSGGFCSLVSAVVFVKLLTVSLKPEDALLVYRTEARLQVFINDIYSSRLEQRTQTCFLTLATLLFYPPAV